MVTSSLTVGLDVAGSQGKACLMRVVKTARKLAGPSQRQLRTMQKKAFDVSYPLAIFSTLRQKHSDLKESFYQVHPTKSWSNFLTPTAQGPVISVVVLFVLVV